MPTLRFRRKACWLLLAAGLLLPFESIPAQQPGNSRPKASQITSDGKILGASAGLLQVQDEKEGAVWWLKPSGPGAIVAFTGSATADWLAPGMLARISATFDRKGTALEPVAELQVFTPRPEYQLGVFPEAPMHSRDGSQQLLVAGRITRIQDGQITIAAGRKAYRAELAENVSVQVDLLGDLNWIQVGDKVSFKARYFQPGQGLATELTVQSQTRLTAAPQSRADRRRRPRGGQDEVPPESAEEGAPPIAE